MVNDECDRQNSLVNGLLDLLQLDRPTEIERINIKLEDFVQGIITTYQQLAKERQIQLGYTIPGNLPIVSCPTSWLRQIIVHLLNNSLQYTPPEGKVFVHAAVQHEYVELTVSDTGIGIEAKDLTRIFDGFYRIKTYNSDRIAGAGLGLTIVRQLIQRCGGSISVTSKPGKGSSFKVSLPIVPIELLNED
jgi:signal transduction histidine kinase